MSVYCTLAVMLLVATSQSQVNGERIIGGHEVPQHSRPYMVLLELLGEKGFRRHCGGFLVREDFVLTAAHCQEKSYKVFYGMNKYNQNHKYVSVEQEFPHRDYKENTFTNDIMLLKLDSKLPTSNNVKTIDLASEQGASMPSSCSVCGWGLTSEPRMSSKLMEVSVTLVDNEQCVKENAYCSTGEKGPRQGDSGGPLVCEDGKAYGVVSASQENDGSYLYKYTKIPDYIDWITNTTKQNSI